MANIIREDVVKLNFDVGSCLQEIEKLKKDISELKKKLTGAIDDGAFDDLKDGANESSDAMDKAKKAAKGLNDKLQDIGKKGATAAFNGLKKIAGISFKALMVGAGAVAAGIGKIAYEAVQAYAEFEQLKGGVETLLGAKGAKNVQEYAKLVGKSVNEVEKEYSTLKKSEDLVLKNANNAYKTAGLSANEYMETVTSFSASLLQSVGGDTVKAAKYADMAVSDMADNANKMGTDMGSIQYAYQGFAKQNYTMLDNLKLGYGGTKEEMKRLVKDAAKLDKSVDANSLSYGNIVQAIHAVQVQMGVYGTTQKEAEKTITGSLNAMKSSWGNLLTAMASGENLDQCIDNMVSSVEIFAGNVMPVAEKALMGLGTVVEKLAPIIAEKLPDLAEKLLPPLIKATVSLTKGLIKALPNIIKTVFTTVGDILGDQFPALAKLGKFFEKNGEKIEKFIPILLGLVGAFMAFSKIKSIASVFSGLFGGKGGKDSSKGGIGSFFESLAKLKTTTVLKGMGNLAIIMGGFMILGAAMASIAPALSEITDFGELIEAFGIVSIVAVEGMIMTKAVEPLAKMKTTTVLKGMGNLAIIFGGMTILTTAFVEIAPYIAKIGDARSIIEASSIMLALGGLGTVLSIFGEIVGKIKVSTVSKGLANMAIMFAGMSALFLLVGAVSLIKLDYGRVLALVGIIGVIGLVATALAIFGGIVGMIPVMTVTLGLANMGIIMAGMSALVLLIGALSLLKFDYGRLFRLVALIGVLGLVGGALTLFAGIVGVIPTPVILTGLANITLVLGGVSALIVAFGALSKIKGFTEFIESGGELLAKIFGVIGECVGSIIGGVGKGLTDSLPAIGENISKFAETLKPMCESFSGMDMGGIGEFFKAIGSFLLQMAGNNILEFFTGSPDFSGVAEGLNTFASSDGVKNFFNMINEIPTESFEKGKAFFECLDGISKLPNTGGLANLFGGENDFSGVATGLGQLAGEGVKKFFTMVSGLDAVAFDNAKLFFGCMDEIKNLPNSGGFASLFGGENDFSGVATGLGQLAGEGVKNFFAMVSGLDESAFEKTNLLFEALGNISKLKNEGGVFQSIGEFFGGENDLVSVGEQLGSFAEKTGTFFSQVNSLNLDNLNGLWKSLKSAGKLTTENLGSVIDESISTLVQKISELPQKMGDALKNNSKNLSDGLVEMWKEAVKASVAPVNKLLDGANHILKEFGSKKKVIEWTPYAKGTDGHKGGNALVNDGRGAELVQMPNGNTFIPNGRNVFIPNAPQGMKVLPAEQTAQMMGKSTPTFNYAKGVGELDVWSYYDNAKGLVDKITEGISYEGMTDLASNVGKGMVSTFSGEMPAWINKLFEECGQTLASYVPSKGVTQWLPTVIRALKMEGQYSAGNVARTLYQMKTESGGNPKAINLWDSNAKKGIPSKGLMQVIDPTFKAYAKEGFNKNIYDPLSNILASIRYAVSRYGSLSKAYRGVGYANGGFANKPSVFGEDGLEAAIPLSKDKRDRGLSLWEQTGRMLGVSYTPESGATEYNSSITEQNTYAPELHFHIEHNSSTDDRTLMRKIKKVAREAIADVIEGAERTNPKVKET